jgi:hypothetical protein
MKANLASIIEQEMQKENMNVEDKFQDAFKSYLQQMERDFDRELERVLFSLKDKIEIMNNRYNIDLRGHREDIEKEIFNNLYKGY